MDKWTKIKRVEKLKDIPTSKELQAILNNAPSVTLKFFEKPSSNPKSIWLDDYKFVHENKTSISIIKKYRCLYHRPFSVDGNQHYDRCHVQLVTCKNILKVIGRHYHDAPQSNTEMRFKKEFKQLTDEEFDFVSNNILQTYKMEEQSLNNQCLVQGTSRAEASSQNRVQHRRRPPPFLRNAWVKPPW